MERTIQERDGMMRDKRWKSIKLLSELRAKYSCFDEKEEPYYRALSFAIASIREKMDADNEEQALEESKAEGEDEEWQD